MDNNNKSGSGRRKNKEGNSNHHNNSVNNATNALAEFLEQQQRLERERNSSPSSSSTPPNPLSLLQQQMNAIMNQGGGGGGGGGQGSNTPPPSHPAMPPGLGGFPPGAGGNPAAAWWYLEYLSRAAQLVPPGASGNNNSNSTTERTSEKKSKKKEERDRDRGEPSSSTHPPPPVPVSLPLPLLPQRPSSSSRSSGDRGFSPGVPGRGRRTSTSSGSKRTSGKLPASTAMNLNLLGAMGVSTSSRMSPPRKREKTSGRVGTASSNLPRPLPSPSPSLSVFPIPATTAPSSSSSSQQPPPAHSTPINLSNPPSKNPVSKSPPPAHQASSKVEHYTHMIPRLPQMGLIGGSRGSSGRPSSDKMKKKSTVASLLAESKSQQQQHHSMYRPWLEQQEPSGSSSTPPPLPLPTKLVIPNIKEPDYVVPLKNGWKRETTVKTTDYKTIFEGPVTYVSPQGIACISIAEVKKSLKSSPNPEITVKNFTFNTTPVPLGHYNLEFEGETVQVHHSELDEDLMKALAVKKEQIIIEREEKRLIALKEEQEQIDKERKRQHQMLIKHLESFKKSKKRLKQQKLKKNKQDNGEEEQKITKELKAVDELTQKGAELKELKHLESALEPNTFSNLLQVHEFLNTFGETLGFDMDSLPDLEELLKGFISHPENEEELQSILIHLIVCAVEDPGMPNPTKHLTAFNQTLKQADVNFGSLSEILRIYLEGISDSEPEAEIYSTWLAEAPFTCHNPRRKTEIVAYLCDILLQNKAVLKHLEASSELINNCKKERMQNDVKIRKLRMVLARRAVADAAGDEEKEQSIDEEEEDKLTVDELKAKINQLQNANEKLKKQIQTNFKNIRTPAIGQDRYRRRYWNLPFSGGIYVEGGISGEFEDMCDKVNEKFERGEGDTVINDENDEPEEEEATNLNNIPPVFEVPPPVIKIFSFIKDPCSGKIPVPPTKKKPGPTDDELLVKKITKEHWNYYYALEEKEITEFRDSLVEHGVREGDLKHALEDIPFIKKIPKFEDVDPIEFDEDIGVDPELIYKTHLGLIEAIEGLEERVAGASLQIKNWVLPLPRNLHNSTTPMEKSEIIQIVKERVLDLEQAIERRYLKPPLGKSTAELNLSNLVGEDNVVCLTNEQMLNMSGPMGSTSSTRGQQIQENNKLKEQKEKEERLEKANETKNSCSRFLSHWRESVRKTSSPSVLSMAIYLLDSSIAWDKSVMKACCQLCKGGDNEDKLLLCDACDRGYHTYCFKPPLEQIPDGDWFCFECINKATGIRGCIVCGKGNLQGKKLLACDKCVKAFHTDCIVPNVTKIPRGRWYCPDHAPNASSTFARASASVVASTSPKKSKTKQIEPPPPSETSSSDSQETKKNKKQKKELEWCEKILEDLMGHEDAWPFLEPVNTRQFPTYKKVIKIPMDLSTIKSKLQSSTYKTRDCFLTDVRLIFDNCEIFNEDDSPVGKAGHNLRLFFESLNNFNSCESTN